MERGIKSLGYANLAACVWVILKIVRGKKITLSWVQRREGGREKEGKTELKWTTIIKIQQKKSNVAGQKAG